MKLTAALVLLFSLTLFVHDSRCRCVASDEPTRAGANERIVIRMPGKYRQLAGVVEDANLQVVSDVLVEVFDKPEYLLLEYPESEQKQKGQRRIAGCVVGADGKFRFRGLRPGKYELRFSKAGGWNHTHVYGHLAEGWLEDRTPQQICDDGAFPVVIKSFIERLLDQKPDRA